MWAEWIVGDGTHHNEWFPVSQRQEDRSAMAVRDGVNGYYACAPRNNQQSRMKVWAILRMAYQFGQGMEEWVRQNEQTAKEIASVTMTIAASWNKAA
jgi:hypothetical protein